MTYSFEAGPETERYTVDTEYAPEAIDSTMRETGISREVIHGLILMIQGVPEGLLDTVILSTDGTGRSTTLRELKTLLEQFSA